MKKSPVAPSREKGRTVGARVFNVLMFGIIFVLLFLLLKENEGRVSAEEKLKDIRYKVDAFANEKENVITNLEGRIGELENKLQESQSQYKLLVAQREQEVNDLNTQLTDVRQKHETMLQEKQSEIADLEQKSTQETAKFNKLLKEKNDEITDLSERLKDASGKISDLLEKKQKLETRNLSLENELSLTKGKLKNLERQHAKLAEAVKESQTSNQTRD